MYKELPYALINKAGLNSPLKMVKHYLKGRVGGGGEGVVEKDNFYIFGPLKFEPLRCKGTNFIYGCINWLALHRLQVWSLAP